MPKFLSDTQIERYTSKGYLSPLRVLSAIVSGEYRQHCDELEELMGGKPEALRLTQMHLSFRWAYELAANPRVLDAVEDLIGPDILIWATSIFAKHSKDAAFVSWHQDATYWGLSSTNVASAWIALAPSTPENGCMRVVPGSHTSGLYPHESTSAANNMLSRGQRAQFDINEKRICDIALQPGEMSLHHVWLVHGSNPNTSQQKRIGFVIRYISPDVRQRDEKPKAILVRGCDRYGHYQLADPPVPKSVREAFEAHEREASEFLASVRRAAL